MKKQPVRKARKPKKPGTPARTDKLFLFTEEEEEMIAEAIESSVRFMETYGKGRGHNLKSAINKSK